MDGKAKFRATGDEMIAPYGGRLVNLLVGEEERAELIGYATTLPSLQLSSRSLCDLELLAVGAFSPMERFIGQADYTSVLDHMRLRNGALFPIPVSLPVPNAGGLEFGKDIALRNPKNELIAIMTVEEIFAPDQAEEAAKVLGSTDVAHPLIAEMQRWGQLYISGRVKVVELPKHFDFVDLRLSPLGVRNRLQELGHSRVVAFQTREPMHRAQEELTKRVAAAVDGALLIHPAVGLAEAGDMDHFTRVRIYKILMEKYYDPSRTVLSLLALAMRMAGPREALWHAIIERNFGANHIIVGRDYASPRFNSEGKSFYGPYDAQELLSRYESDIGVKMVPFRELVYIPTVDRYEERDRIPSTTPVVAMSDAEARRGYLDKGAELPDWYTRPEVAELLRKISPPTHELGFCIWFTGLSGAGKSTIADILAVLLMELGRQVTVLDGDVVRTHLSKGLGFSREDRDTNIRRIGFVASEIVGHRGVVICAAVSPYRSTRNECRMAVGEDKFIEVFVDTPLDVCEHRDAKGMYAKARRGEIQGFTGIDDPYEPPENPDLRLVTTDCVPEDNARRILSLLRERGFIADTGRDTESSTR